MHYLEIFLRYLNPARESSSKGISENAKPPTPTPVCGNNITWSTIYVIWETRWYPAFYELLMLDECQRAGRDLEPHNG